MKSRRVIFIIAALLVPCFILFLFVMSFKQKQVLEVEKFFIYEGSTVLSNKADTSINELNKYKKKEFSDASSISLINSFKIGKNNPYLWKGYWHGVIIFKDKSMHIIRISRYGGFFWDLELKKMFEIEPDSKKDEWQNLINPTIDM